MINNWFHTKCRKNIISKPRLVGLRCHVPLKNYIRVLYCKIQFVFNYYFKWPKKGLTLLRYFGTDGGVSATVFRKVYWIVYVVINSLVVPTRTIITGSIFKRNHISCWTLELEWQAKSRWHYCFSLRYKFKQYNISFDISDIEEVTLWNACTRT